MHQTLESLEPRQHFSAFTRSDVKKIRPINNLTSGAGVTLFLDHNNTLNIAGTSADDQIRVVDTDQGTEVTVSTHPLPLVIGRPDQTILKRLSTGSTVVGRTTGDTVFQLFAEGMIERIRINAGPGHDELTLPQRWSLLTSTRRVETRTTVFANGATAADLARAPLPGLEAGSVVKWTKRFKAQKAAVVKTRPKTVFFGDSLIQRLPDTSPADWADLTQYFGAGNLGFSGDTTSQALYRIANGIFNHLSPKLVFICIGTNNINLTDDITSTVRGIQSVVLAVRQAVPDAKIVLSSILPRDQLGDTAIATAVNRKLSRVYANSAVQFADATALFPQSTAAANFLITSVHLNTSGYTIWDKFIASELKRALAGA